jgi:hypothetical protein
MSCIKCTLSNLTDKIIVINYQECSNLIWEYNVEIFPNQTINVWHTDGSLSSVNLNLLNPVCSVFPPTPPISPTPSSTPSETGTPTPTPTNTSSETPTPTPTNTSSQTPTPTPTNTSSETPTPTPTNTSSQTPTPTGTLTPTPTPSSESVIINPILIGNDEYLIVGENEYLEF